jgi:outer membrane receptor protein involved in Fe transport
VAQRAFTKLDASITLTSPNEAFSLALVGKNLTDKTTAHFGDDIPLSNILGNNYEQYVDPPRTIAVQLQFKFR